MAAVATPLPLAPTEAVAAWVTVECACQIIVYNYQVPF